ncbi:uncharacterized protein LOC134773073 [Penaeus indicus]|uniref:uncharacterized protein LOC134773073 n=1 Tax=Penaeus indicus TaxID=29960 RepID=UPI00300C77C2
MKKEGRPRIDTNKTCDSEKVEEFARVLEESLPGPPDASALERWEHFRDTMYNATMTTFGKKTLNECNLPVAKPSSVPGNAPTTTGFSSAPRHSWQQTQATSKACTMVSSRPWAQKNTEENHPLKPATGEVIQDWTQQMERWVEHYLELYARENIVTEDALNAIKCLPMLEELDAEPTLDELATGKAPGKDGIPAEVLKCCKGSLITELHEILCLCWREGEVPQDMRDANIVTLYKNKVRVQSQQVYQHQIPPLEGTGIGRAWEGFLKHVCKEKCREQRQPLFVAFIDLTKAFDLVSRESLFEILPKIGCPPRLLSIIRSFHDMKGTVAFDGSTSNAFDIRNEVKPGCVLALTLFGIFFAAMLKHAFCSATDGIYLRTRSDGKLFNLSRRRAKSKAQLKCLRDFFADDAAVTAHSAEDLQQFMTHFSDACRDFGLTISLKKTQDVGQDVNSPPSISISDYELEVVHDFVYLGSTISDSLSLDTELNKRIGKAAMTMSRPTKRVWTNGKLTEHTKIKVYRACALSPLLYGNESWTLRAQQERKLNAFHMRCLRRILHITWQDKITNNSVRERAGITSMYTLLKQRRMRWLGHVVCMNDGRIPKDLIYGELAQGKRPTGRPQQRYKDVCKRDLKAMDIDLTTWEAAASDRAAWRQTVQKDLSSFEQSLVQQSEAKRQRRKARGQAE